MQNKSNREITYDTALKDTTYCPVAKKNLSKQSHLIWAYYQDYLLPSGKEEFKQAITFYLSLLSRRPFHNRLKNHEIEA